MFDTVAQEKRQELAKEYAPPPGAIAGAWYDEKYYEKPGTKSNWPHAYTWENFGELFRKIAHFVISGFPFSKSFLEVGCAKGFLLRAMIEHAAKNNLELSLHGFDHSQYAIDNADPMVKEFVECAGIDEFEFGQSFDVILAFDVLEHLTEAQSFNFLLRARKYCNHAILAVIPYADYFGDIELSHINKKSRAYWDNLFRSNGWTQDEYALAMQKAAMEDSWVRALRWNVHYYIPQENNNV